MKVICAGLSKTGTKSMAKALQLLGFSVYDADEHLFIHYQHWWEIFIEGKKPDFLAMYRNVDAVTDIPPAAFYEDIFKSFPEAKVILMERDSEDIWVESAINQSREFERFKLRPTNLFVNTVSPTLRKIFKVLDSAISFIYGTPAGGKTSKYLLKKRYREHNVRVKRVIPPEQLLVYKVTQGWKPLCEFLECEEPLTPFPHQNIRGEVLKKYGIKNLLTPHDTHRKILGEILMAFSVFVLLFCFIIYHTF